MNKMYMKMLCVAGMTLLGGVTYAQSTQTSGKDVGPQVDSVTLAQHLETVNTPEVSPAPAVQQDNSGIVEVDYGRLQRMPEAQRKEILANPDKYRIINQPK